MSKKSNLTTSDVTVLAAIFARSNMGMGLPDAKDVARVKSWNDPELQSVVMNFCAQFMETDEHERIFVSEGKGWVKDLKKRDREYLYRVHPEIAKLYFDETGTVNA